VTDWRSDPSPFPPVQVDTLAGVGRKPATALRAWAGRLARVLTHGQRLGVVRSVENGVSRDVQVAPEEPGRARALRVTRYRGGPGMALAVDALAAAGWTDSHDLLI
jgi:hypothetical protein